MTATDHRPHPLEHASTLLATHAGGAVDREAADALLEMVQAVRDTGKKGAVTITFAATDAGDRQIILTAQVATKIPKPSPEAGIYWISNEGIHHNDPWQQSFDALDPDTGDFRDPRTAPDTDPTAARSLED